MTTPTPTTTLTPEQITEAERYLKAKAEANWQRECEKIRARLNTLAAEAVREALACPGVESAVKDDAGSYFNATHICVRYTGQREGARGGYICIKLDGYTADRPAKITAKARASRSWRSTDLRGLGSARLQERLPHLQDHRGCREGEPEVHARHRGGGRCLDGAEGAGPVDLDNRVTCDKVRSMTTILVTAEQKEAFFTLLNRLSPENLSCDGECSRAEQKRRLAAIRKEWKALEARIGRKVSVEEAEGWWMDHYRAEQAARAARRAARGE